MKTSLKTAGLALGCSAWLAACATTSQTTTGAARPKADRAASTDPSAPQAGPTISNRALLAFEDGVKAFEAQKKTGQFDYPALEKRFAAAVEADENLAEGHYNLGVVAERQGRFKEAAGHYRTALEKKPSLRQAAENLAVLAQNQGNEKGAIALYTDLLAAAPDDASSRARLAEIYRRKGDTERASQLAREALFRDPRSLQAYKTLMSLAIDQKQYSMARLIVLRASRLDESDPEIYYGMGLVHLAEKDSVKARGQFKRALEVRPDFLPAHYQLAKMAFEQENYAGAEVHLRRILQANGNNAEALVNLGVAYKGLGQLDKAMQAYDAAQKVKADIPELYLNRGIIIGLKGDPAKAIAYFKQYLQLKPDAQVDANHAVHALIKDQEAVITAKEEEKKALEEASRLEEEAKKVEAAAQEEERKKKEEEFKKQQSEAKGNTAKDAVGDGAPPGAAPEPDPTQPESGAAPGKPTVPAPKAAPAPAPAPSKGPAPAKAAPADEPSEAL